jgi:prephenate dehydrogenase
MMPPQGGVFISNDVPEEATRPTEDIMTSLVQPACPNPPASQRRRPSIGIIGVGAFGEFCIPHLCRSLRVKLYDPVRDLGPLCDRHEVEAVNLDEAARQDIILLALPFRHFRSVAQEIAPHLRPGSLVVDVCSIKTKPLLILEEELPPTVDIIGMHPLFGPQSGRDGIKGLRIVLCPVRGGRGPIVERFLRRELELEVIRMTAEQHDRQMAYVQGLTHLIARIVVAMDVPPLEHTTTTFSHLDRMVGMVRHDSDELFRTIIEDNPFVDDVMRSFVKATKDVLQPFGYPANSDALS